MFAREPQFIDVTPLPRRANGVTSRDGSPAIRARDTWNYNDIALCRRLSQVRLSSTNVEHLESSAAAVHPPHPTSFARLFCSPARIQLTEYPELQEQQHGLESSSPTARRFPRMGTRSERPSSWSPGRVLPSFAAATGVPDIQSSRRFFTAKQAASSSSPPQKDASMKPRKLFGDGHVTRGEPDREHYLVNGHVLTFSSAMQKNCSIGQTKVNNGPEMKLNKPTQGVAKWPNGLSNLAINKNVNKQRDLLISAGNAKSPFVSATRQRQEIDHCRQLRHHQLNILQLASDNYENFGDIVDSPFDRKFQQTVARPSNGEQQCRSSRRDEFHHACAPQRDNSSSPALARPKRNRDNKQLAANNINNNTNYATIAWNRAQDSPRMRGSSSPHQGVPIMVDHAVMPIRPPPPAQLDWVVRRRSDGTRYFSKRRHSTRDRILRERERRLAEERCSTTTTTSTTTEDDVEARLSWPKSGHYYSRDIRRRQFNASRERKSRRQKALLQRICDAAQTERLEQCQL